MHRVGPVVPNLPGSAEVLPTLALHPGGYPEGLSRDGGSDVRRTRANWPCRASYQVLVTRCWWEPEKNTVGETAPAENGGKIPTPATPCRERPPTRGWSPGALPPSGVMGCSGGKKDSAFHPAKGF